jgi:zinc protease
MQLTAAYLTDPGKREEAVRLYRRGLPEWFSRRDATPQAALGSKTGSIMTDNDPRFSIPSQALVESADFRAIDAALGDALTGNRLEIGLVGALDENEAVAIVARTFGALPKRKSDATDYADARTITWSSARGTHEISHRGEPNQLSWQRIWTTADDSDQRLKLSLELFASMAQIRLLDELRERLGKTYGAFARSSMSDTYAGRGTFTISTDGDPKDLAAIESAVDSVMAEMLAAPASPDLFERARKPALESYVDWRKSNGTWWWLTSIAQTQPYRLQRYRDDEKIYRSLSADEVWQTAKRMLEGKPSFTFRALPAKS